MVQNSLKFEECPLQQNTPCRKRGHTLKGPLRVVRLCLLGIALPTALFSVPLYLRYHVYANQLYPFAVSDMMLLDRRISTVWCQRQLVSVNATFNAFLLSESPPIAHDQKHLSMARDLILDDDMKEYWGFYLLSGSTITVSTCVRWPGASLTIIRGHKHLHECAYIGDDSSEELDELLELMSEGKYVRSNDTSEEDASANRPQFMKRHHPDIVFHDPLHNNAESNNVRDEGLDDISEITDPKLVKSLLDSLSKKAAKKRKRKSQKTRENLNKNKRNQEVWQKTQKDGVEQLIYTSTSAPALNYGRSSSVPSRAGISLSHLGTFSSSESGTHLLQRSYPLRSDSFPLPENSIFESDEDVPKLLDSTTILPSPTVKTNIILNVLKSPEIQIPPDLDKNKKSEKLTSSEELFQEVAKKLDSLGERQHRVLQKLNDRLIKNNQGQQTRDSVNQADITKQTDRRKRDLIIATALADNFNSDDEARDAAVEEGFTSDGIADHRGFVNETTLNDRSNSEFWSSFSSSEEALLNCDGLILNLPLTPHHNCESHQSEDQLKNAALTNTITYLVPKNGYYFFVFNSENEVQTNYIRVRFDLNKTMYDVSDPVSTCSNSTEQCALNLGFFSAQKMVMEVPVSLNESRWNEEFVVVSECEPRTMVYMCCVISVPILIMLFAFQ